MFLKLVVKQLKVYKNTMLNNNTPSWLKWMEKRFGFIAMPNLAITLVGLQAIGFILVMSERGWYRGLYLDPQLVLQGEVWRLVTFLCLPLSTSIFWVLFVLWFLYFIIDVLEKNWGEFKSTFYVLISYLLMIAFSFAFNYPITHIGHFESTLFLAAATVMPDYEILLFFVLPVKMKWLAALTGAFAIFAFAMGTNLDRIYLMAIYANYLLFFGPAFAGRIKAYIKRKNYQKQLHQDDEDA